MLKIDFLKNHPEAIPELVEIWCEGIAKIWLPDYCIDRVKNKLYKHLNDSALPLTFVAFDDNKPIGMCSLRENDGIRLDLTPWLGSLVVSPSHQNNGVAKSLIDAVLAKAKELGFDEVYLFAFDPTIPAYYEKIGWAKIGLDTFEGHQVTVMKIRL